MRTGEHRPNLFCTCSVLAFSRRCVLMCAFCLRVWRCLQVKVAEKKETTSLGPLVIGFFLFVVVGSALFQIIRTAQSGRAF